MSRYWEHESCSEHEWIYERFEYGGRVCQICGLHETSGGLR